MNNYRFRFIFMLLAAFGVSTIACPGYQSRKKAAQESQMRIKDTTPERAAAVRANDSRLSPEETEHRFSHEAARTLKEKNRNSTTNSRIDIDCIKDGDETPNDGQPVLPKCPVPADLAQ